MPELHHDVTDGIVEAGAGRLRAVRRRLLLATGGWVLVAAVWTARAVAEGRPVS